MVLNWLAHQAVCSQPLSEKPWERGWSVVTLICAKSCQSDVFIRDYTHQTVTTYMAFPPTTKLLPSVTNIHAYVTKKWERDVVKGTRNSVQTKFHFHTYTPENQSYRSGFRIQYNPEHIFWAWILSTETREFKKPRLLWRRNVTSKCKFELFYVFHDYPILFILYNMGEESCRIWSKE